MAIDINNLDFCPAGENDIDDIVETTNFYYNAFDNAFGFLAGKRTHSQVFGKLNCYYVAKSGGEFLGHVQVSRGLPEEFELLDWYDCKHHEMLKMLERSGKVLYIDIIAVRNSFCNAGVGKFLYYNLFETFKESVFFSSVIVKPYSNKHSLDFHKCCGFTEVAYNKNDLIGAIRFESIYLARFAKSEKNENTSCI